MLIEFSVANYRSFLERQTLSMVVGSGRDWRARHVLETGHRTVPRLLRSAVVYGPNAAGKSNLVLAMQFFRNFVVSSAKEKQEGEEILITPFKLTKKSAREPSEFEVVFIENDNRYQYGFSVNEKRVWHEWLFAVPSGGRTQRWFERSYNPNTSRYDWYINPSLKGLRKVWKESTRDNALFLSTAVQLKSESLREPFDWFQNRLRILTSPDRLSNSFSVAKCREEQWKKKIFQFLKAADLGITDIVVREKELSPEDFSEDFSEEIKKDLLASKFITALMIHKDEDGDDVAIDLEDESDGTNVLFSLSFPWLDILENGLVLFVDELHNSLHPHALRFLVDLIHNRERNRHNAQLIFTAHETSLMSGGFIGRDQIWLVEKDQKQATKLYPLSDFKPRKGEALEKGYLGGRYGALPKIKELA